MTGQQAIDKVWRLARERGLDLDSADIESSLSIALQIVGEDVSKRPDFTLLQKTFTVAFAGGVADLSGEPMLLVHTITRVVHPNIDVDVVCFLGWNATRTDLARASIAPYYRYVIEADKLYIRHWDGLSDVVDGDLMITANAVPTIDGNDDILIHHSLEDEFILAVLSLATTPKETEDAA